MLAGSAADLDGLSIIAGYREYEIYHHTLAHNAMFIGVCSAVLAVLSPQKLKSLLIYLGLMHLHLAMDFVGSGPDWGICYLWPFSHRELIITWGWELYSWQNISTAYAFLACTLAIAAFAGRTPLEILMPSLDRQLVDLLRRAMRLPPLVRNAPAASAATASAAPKDEPAAGSGAVS